MTIGGENDPPNAVNDLGLHVPEGAGATALAVLANDDDPDGDDLTITVRDQRRARHRDDHRRRHRPDLRPGQAGSTGPTRSPTRSSDGHGGTDHATVLVIVDPDTAAPVAVAPLQRLPGQTLGTSSAKVRISWSASDPGSGVTSYQLQVSVERRHVHDHQRSPKATTTSIDQTLTYGRTYRFRVRANDHEGNVAPTPTGRRSRPGATEETNSAVTYVGTWSTIKRDGGHRRGGALHRGAATGRPRSPTATRHRAGRDPHARQRPRPGLRRRRPGRDRQPAPLVDRLPPGRSSPALRDARAPTPSRSGPSATAASTSTPSWSCADRPKVAARSQAAPDDAPAILPRALTGRP